MSVMDRHADTKERRFVDDYDDKIAWVTNVQKFDAAHAKIKPKGTKSLSGPRQVEFSDDGNGFAEAHDDYDHNSEEKENDQGFAQHSYEDDDDSQVPSSIFEDQAHGGGRARAESEDGLDAGIKISQKDDHRLLGAFLLAADGGLDGGGSVAYSGGGRDGELQLSTDAYTCLKKFTTIAASLGLKTTREQLREDFEKVVRSNRLVESSSGDPWLGAYDTERPVIGFTYKVFRRYYLAKIQGELLETNIRQAWDDLHQGTGGKLIRPEPSATEFEAAEAPVAASGGEDRKRNDGHHHNQNHQHHHPHGNSDKSDGDYRGRPYVARAELQKILTRDGEALTDEEVDELLRECRPDEEGRIVYEGYRRMLIDPSL